MKSFNQFYSEAIVLAKKGGVEGKLDKSTGKFTAGNFSDAERARYAKYSAKPAAAAPKPAATGVSGGAAPAPRPAATSTRPPRPAAPALSPRPRDERPTVGQVQAAEREAEYQRYARNLRLGKEIGADDMVKQMYRNQNSLVAQGARASNQAPWKTHPHTLNKKVGRGYGSQRLSAMLQDNSTSQLTDFYQKKGMSYDAAYAKASKEAQRIHDKNRADYRSGSGYDV